MTLVAFFFLPPASAPALNRPSPRSATASTAISLPALICLLLRLGKEEPNAEPAPNLLVPVGDSAAVQVVGRELDLHPVTRKDADVVAAHLARDVAEDLVIVVQLDAEHRVGQRLGDLALHLDFLFLRHQRPGRVAGAPTSPRTSRCRDRPSGSWPRRSAGPPRRTGPRRRLE